MYVGRNDVVTFRNKILAIVTDYLDKTIIEKDMKAQLSLSEVVSGKAEIIYRAKQTGNETVYFNILAAANTGTSMIAPEVNGKRRLCTFDSSVKNISGVFSLSMSYADSWDNPQSMIVQLTFDNGKLLYSFSRWQPTCPNACKYYFNRGYIKDLTDNGNNIRIKKTGTGTFGKERFLIHIT